MNIDDQSEWLEADGLGGFASGTASGVRTRRYHALLVPATTPPTGRVVLVNGFDAYVDTVAGSCALTSQRYAPDALWPDGASRIVSFSTDPWPTWMLGLPRGATIVQEIFIEHGTGVTFVSWTLAGDANVTLRARPFLSGRDYHSTHHENGAFRFDGERAGQSILFRPYVGIPSIRIQFNGDYAHGPDWYRQFLYTAERDRGLDATEDLATPGEFVWRLSHAGDRAIWMFEAGSSDRSVESRSQADVEKVFAAAHEREQRRRRGFDSRLERAADSYIAQRGRGKTIVAGYPWFTDWGRDTFIAARGLCLATGRLRDARDILVEWAGAVSEGMLPNRFPDRGESPEFNAVDASLWYVVAAGDLLSRIPKRSRLLARADRTAVETAILDIVRGYAAGTRFGIRMDHDGLLAAGVPGMQLTWMDARVGDRVITPRIGKPVEVQALWINALGIVSQFDRSWREPFERGRSSFVDRFWNEPARRLADVVDVDHVAGTRDDAFRPNQIFAVGGLPLAILDGERARAVVDAVEHGLVTPLGLRSLAPDDGRYIGHYAGDPSTRDAAYHQGTVWPWLMGAFVDAWLRVRGNTAGARRIARQRFAAPLLAHLDSVGLDHVSEIADAEPPFTPKGCPFQAWSLGELVRLEREICPPVEEPHEPQGVELRRPPNEGDATATAR